MFKPIFACVAVLACLASPAFSKSPRPSFKAPPGGKLISCTMTQRPRGNWIQPEIFVVVDKSGKTVAYDPVIAHVHGQPVTARITVDNARRTTYAWTVKGARDSGSQYAPYLDYKLTIVKATNRASLSMIPRGFSNTFRGEGACREE
ncbi:hypothetical protein SAMN05877809_102480 [Rhodobacter sp. JA431]|nr:hypothetical protein SAMN05877809_102480 [Rhodobacter sp. JA431]